MKLPPPEAPLAGCMFLPRIIAKARAMKTGELPQEYAARFGAANGVDGLFLGFFDLSADQITEAAALDDAAVEKWFNEMPGVTAQRIREWNHTAVNLGRPGFPMADRLPIAPTSKYRHLANRGVETIFQILNADEETGAAAGTPPMPGQTPPEITLLLAAYAAFNRRDIDAALATMTPDVAWPMAFKGGFVRGPEEIRAYWTQQWSEIDPHVEPVAFYPEEGGPVLVDVHQVVRDLAGALLADLHVGHRFTLSHGLIRAMEISELPSG
jgi:hypothetical protein